jgi:hypothetical protein
MVASIFSSFYFAFMGVYDLRFWIPSSLVILEIIVIVSNKWKCPVTNIAEKYTDERQSNFDIYLPEWLAKYNVKIFSGIIVLEIIIVLIKRLMFKV